MLPQFSLKLTENCYFKISTVIKGKGFQENPNLTVLRCTQAAALSFLALLILLGLSGCHQQGAALSCRTDGHI